MSPFTGPWESATKKKRGAGSDPGTDWKKETGKDERAVSSVQKEERGMEQALRKEEREEISPVGEISSRFVFGKQGTRLPLAEHRSAVPPPQLVILSVPGQNQGEILRRRIGKDGTHRLDKGLFSRTVHDMQQSFA